MFETIRTAGGLHFVIGMVGRSPEGPVVEGGIRPQTRRSLERIEAVLEGVGRSRKDIVRLRFYLTDMREWPRHGTRSSRSSASRSHPRPRSA